MRACGKVGHERKAGDQWPLLLACSLVSTMIFSLVRQQCRTNSHINSLKYYVGYDTSMWCFLTVGNRCRFQETMVNLCAPLPTCADLFMRCAKRVSIYEPWIENGHNMILLYVHEMHRGSGCEGVRT